VCVCVQTSSEHTSRCESESLAATVAEELAGKMADVDIVDSCHGDTSLPADTASVDVAEAEESERVTVSAVCADTEQLADKLSDAVDTVIPSADEDSEEGMCT